MPSPGDSSSGFERFQSLLREMLHLDRGDLDFGIYRIMRMKADELERFLDRDLRASDVEDAEVYAHLVRFFERYYREGDFMSLRRYSTGAEPTYLIPYDGEEVKLHWANADQYYVKTTENYASYAFLAGAFRVRFEIARADDDDNEQHRRFVLAGEDAVALEEGELVVRFEHRPLTEREKRIGPGNGSRQQGRIDAATAKRILAAAGELAPSLLAALERPAPTEANPERTLLARHIGRYTAKNRFDYFIHRDLGGFLRRELDLYLKTDVLDLEDLERSGDRALARMRTIRSLGGKIIAFLAQLEDFQKRLWLKKKFVLATRWCVTLDRALKALFPEIAANEAQWAEWAELFGVDAAASGRLRLLEAHPHLMLDTRHFPGDFTDRLLAALSDAGPLDEQIDGTLVHGENFQALRLLQARYADQVRLVYIDPPYNTGSDGFLYKDGYRSSSWMSAMTDRIRLARLFLASNGQFATHIDEHECEAMQWILGSVFGSANHLGAVIWNKRNPKGNARGLAVQHESILWAIRDADALTSGEKPFGRPKKNAHAILAAASRFVRYSSDLDEARARFSAWIRKQDVSSGELAYNRIDDDGRVYQAVSMASPGGRGLAKGNFLPLEHPVTGKPCPVPEKGWRNKPDTMRSLLERNLIAFGPDETTQPRRKYFLEDHMMESISSVFDYGGSSDPEAKALGLEFETMKPLPVAEYVCNYGNDGVLLDFFAGSGTTGHAVLHLNREDGGQRKYILVEMGRHFETVLLPRLKKVVYSPDWKAGKPLVRDRGISQIIKTLRIESWEDTLDGLELTPPDAGLLAESDPALVEDYQLRYALDVETAGSPCLLGRDFGDPFACTLSVVRDGAREETPVDLPETFNLLLGLRVASRRRLDGVLAVAGEDPEGRNCLILWRNPEEVDRETLNAWFRRNRASLPDALERVYVNGDHTLNAIREKSETWTAFSIEPLFRELMFDTDDN